MLQFEEVLEFIKQFRKYSNDDIVIYTGYYPEEIQDKIKELIQYKNIIIKFTDIYQIRISDLMKY